MDLGVSSVTNTTSLWDYVPEVNSSSLSTVAMYGAAIVGGLVLAEIGSRFFKYMNKTAPAAPSKVLAPQALQASQSRAPAVKGSAPSAAGVAAASKKEEGKQSKISGATKITEQNYPQALAAALEKVHATLKGNARHGSDVVEGTCWGGARHPISLSHQNRDDYRSKWHLGVVYFGKLTDENFNTADFASVARTVDELAKLIQEAVDNRFDYGSSLKNSLGVVYRTTNSSTVSHDGYVAGSSKNDVRVEMQGRDELWLDNKPILDQDGNKLSARNIALCAEGGICFVRTEEGHIEAVKRFDRRKGEGVFFDKETRRMFKGDPTKDSLRKTQWVQW